MRIRITNCNNSLLWYNSHIGLEFEVVKQEADIYWVCEPDAGYRLINWVKKNDAELLVKEENETNR